MKNTARVLATATVGIGLAVALGAPAQAAYGMSGGEDDFTWTRTSAGECFFADVLANDTQLPGLQITEVKVMAGAATATPVTDPDGATQLQVCPTADLADGEIIRITYVATATSGADGKQQYDIYGNPMAWATSPVNVTITVATAPAAPEVTAPPTPTPLAVVTAAPVPEVTVTKGATEPAVAATTTAAEADHSGVSVPLLAGSGVGVIALLAGAFALGRRRSPASH